jgi:putative proteasome-type protease
MTYCVGLLVREGLVMVSDTRTNAGVDQISTYSKISVWEKPGERVYCLMSAGNLAISQEVVSLIEEDMGGGDENLMNAPNMFRAARTVGRTVRSVYNTAGRELEAQSVDFSVSLLLGGQIKGEPPRLFMIYSAGNFIESSIETPFLQLGEHKYGKPILDRAMTFETKLRSALKLALISMDSTLRSNLSVGLPIDVFVYRTDELEVALQKRIDEGDNYFSGLRTQWGNALREAYRGIEDPDWFQG